MAHILIIEDDPVLNNAYKLILEKEGHDVDRAFDGAEALALAKVKEPQIILLDLLMPVLDGLGFLRSFDAPKNHPDVKIVILSNVGDEKEAAKGMALGAYKYVVKAHSSPHELSVLVNHLIQKNLTKKAN